MPTCCRCWPRVLSKSCATSLARPAAVAPHPRDLLRVLEQRVGVLGAAEDLAVHVRGVFGRDVRDERRVERRVLLGRRFRARLLEQRRGHAGRARRRDRVHRDAVLAELDRPHEGHAHDPGLGGAVVGLAEVAAQPGRRRDVDDAAVALLLHHRRRVAGAVERALEVHADHRVEVGLFHLDERLVAHDAGVVHEDVDRAERVDRGLHDAARRRRSR